MANAVQRAREDVANMRNELAKVKASHEDEVKELRCTVEERDKKFEAMRTLWDKDRDDLRRLRDEIQKLQKQNEDLVQENEKLREESEDFMEQERQEKDLARPLIHLHHRLKSQCEEFGHHFADLLWKPAQPRELRILSKLAEYNKELRTKMDLAEGSSPRQQCVDLVTLFKNHRDWEFATMKELVQNSSKLGQAKAVAKDDLPQTLVGNDALMKTGTAARLGFWERSKQEHPWTLCENLFRLEQPFLEPDVAAGVEMFSRGYLAGEDNLKVFRNMYGYDLESCTRLIRRTPQFCALVNAEAMVKMIPIGIEESDIGEVDEWISLCDKLWQDWEELGYAVICGDESLTDWLPDSEAEMESVRDIVQRLVEESKDSDN